MTKLTLTTNHWDHSYENYKDFLAFTTQDVSNILTNVNPSAPKTLLDIGSGTGQLGRELFLRGYTTIGIDGSKRAIEIAKEAAALHEDSIRYIHKNFEDFSEEGSTFGLITCKYVFAFIEDRVQFLEKVNRLLSEDGSFVIISPHVDKIPKEKAGISVDNSEILALLKDIFHVESYERGRDYYYICKKMSA